MRPLRLTAIVVALASATPATAQFGDLAPGGAVTWSMAGVRVEVGVTFAMEPRFAAGRLPRGFQPFTLSDLAASGDTAARAILAVHPDRASHLIATLGAATIDSFDVDRISPSARPVSLAFWWVPVRPTAALPDSRAPSGEHMVELGFWSADTRFAERLGAVMPSAAAAPLTITWDGAGGWRVRLTIPQGRIFGTCRLVGTPAAMRYALPAFTTVWAADSVAGPFTVFTYYGHQAQRCTGSWQATGMAALARAIDTGAILRSGNQNGWRARAAAYLPR